MRNSFQILGRYSGDGRQFEPVRSPPSCIEHPRRFSSLRVTFPIKFQGFPFRRPRWHVNSSEVAMLTKYFAVFLPPQPPGNSYVTLRFLWGALPLFRVDSPHARFCAPPFSFNNLEPPSATQRLGLFFLVLHLRRDRPTWRSRVPSGHRPWTVSFAFPHGVSAFLFSSVFLFRLPLGSR